MRWNQRFSQARSYVQLYLKAYFYAWLHRFDEPVPGWSFELRTPFFGVWFGKNIPDLGYLRLWTGVEFMLLANTPIREGDSIYCYSWRRQVISYDVLLERYQ